MHTRRLATFLLGAWIAGCGLLAVITLRTTEITQVVLLAPAPPVAEIVQKLGYERSAQFVRHIAGQQVSALADTWELVQIGLALLVAACLYLATERRIIPLVVCGAMLAMVLFQHVALGPEIAFRSRETDFPPGSADVALMGRVWALRQAYFGIEAIKVIAGGLLASYLFVFRSDRKKLVKPASKNAVAV